MGLLDMVKGLIGGEVVQRSLESTGLGEHVEGLLGQGTGVVESLGGGVGQVTESLGGGVDQVAESLGGLDDALPADLGGLGDLGAVGDLGGLVPDVADVGIPGRSG